MSRFIIYTALLLFGIFYLSALNAKNDPILDSLWEVYKKEGQLNTLDQLSNRLLFKDLDSGYAT